MKKAKAVLFTVIIILAVLLAGLLFLLFNYQFIDGVIIPKDSADDLRGKELSFSQYESICNELGTKPRWDVPLGSARFDSASKNIAVGNFAMDELGSFAYFTELETVDASAADCYEELMALKEAYPALEVIYSVAVGTEQVDSAVESYTPKPGVSAEELMEKLKYLPALKQLDIIAMGYAQQQEQKLIDAYPGVSVVCITEIAGTELSGLSKELSLETFSSADIDMLCASAKRLFSLERIDLGENLLSQEQYCAIMDSYPGAEILCRLNFYGVEVSSDTDSLVLDGIQITDTAELDRAVQMLPRLEKVYMSDCGLSDEELDELNNKYEDVRIIWTVYVKWFDCRTDAEDFCVSRITNNYGMMTMTDEVIYPIRYCTDMVTLDLGHMVYYNSDFVENMPNLRFLIMGDTNISSIEALRNNKQLYYLEIFLTDVTDLSPLFELEELRYLNISYCPIEDYTQLFKLTWLEKLWFVRSGLTLEQQEEIRQALPNTEVCFWTSDGSSVDQGWRTTDGYYEMRDNLGMFYHFG